eukprot:m.222784 g.222784  ORF g.222784 m.222784 type:complete len:197 (-) comp16101_c0_seq1:112-702(-)
MAAPTLHYWGFKARAHLPVLVAAFAEQPLNWNKTPEWPGMKDKTPFGQLPYLEDGDVKIAQSMAIARYLARKYKLDGETLTEFAASEQLVEESTDLYTLTAKANYAPDKAAAYAKLFAEDVPRHLAFLEKLLHGTTFTGKVLLGDLAVFAILNTLVDLEPTALDKTPKVKAFYDHVLAIPSINAAVSAVPAYFKRG